MAFFTDMKRSLTEAGKQVAQKTKEAFRHGPVKDAALQGEGGGEPPVRADRQERSSKPQTQSDEEAYSAEFALIRESLKTIDELQNRLSTLEGFIHCPECGARIEKTAAFCSKCGAKIAESDAGGCSLSTLSILPNQSETAGERNDPLRPAPARAVPDEKFEDGSAETTVQL